MNRAQIEARRGIVRDIAGLIIRSKEWIKERVELLEQKVKDCETRRENALAEIAERKKQLKTAPSQEQLIEKIAELTGAKK